MKLNDYLLNILSNLDFTNEDFRLVGLDSTNTSLESKDVYKKLDYIKDQEVFKTNGIFDEQKFDTFYDAVSIGYNELATIDSAKLLAKHLSSSKYNIFADILTINPNGEFIIHKTLNNPTRAKTSVWGGNSLTEGPLSVREIAQTQLIDDNGALTDSPNDMGFFGNFFETKVLATYDEDGTHIDPTTGLLIPHKKGEYKYNHNGTFYYEDLGNRDIYGKQVLSKFDIITTDGSTLNKYDFFDSDDKEKSLTGTLIKSVIKTAPAFIPGINSYYIAARIGLNSLDLFSKIGKMVAGSDSPKLSAIEGFTASLGTSVSDYALLHLWSIENLLNMGADVFLQLAELRWLFTHLPSLLNGNSLGFSEKARKAWKEENVSNLLKKYKIVDKNLDSGTIFTEQYALTAKAVSETNKTLEQILKSNYKLGEYISRAYMTGITTATGYSEAKNTGATDLEATLFTLGLAAGEWGILSTRLGNWILPELQLEKARLAKVIATIHGLNPGKTAPKLEQLNWAMRAIKAGKDWFTKAGFDENTGKVLTKHMVSNSLGEGFEEVTEQAWLDMSKTLFNFVGDLRGDETKLRQTWRNPDGSLNIANTLNDYALNFVGGLIGGGLGNLKVTVLEALKLSDIKDQKGAFLELLYHVREGNKDKLIETANKMLLGEVTKGTSKINEFAYSDATESDNRDLLAKQVFANYLNHLEKLVLMERSVKTDEGISLDLVFKDLRFAKLLESPVLASYLLNYHTAVSDLIATESSIDELTSKAHDSDKLDEKEEDLLKKLEKKAAELRKIVEEYTGETLGIEFIKDAIFSLEKGLSDAYLPSNVLQYIKLKELSLGYNRKLSEIPLVEIDKYVKDWEANAPKLKDDFRSRRLWFEYNNKLVSESIKDHINDYLYDFDVFIGKVDKAIDVKILDNLDENPSLFGKFLDELYSNRDTPESDTNYSKRVAFMDALLQEMVDLNPQAKPLFDMFLAVRRTEREETIQPGTDYYSTIVNGELVVDMNYNPTTYYDIIQNVLGKIQANNEVRSHQDVFLNVVNSIMNNPLVVQHLNDTLGKLTYLSHSARQFLKEFVDWFISDKSAKNTIMETIDLINYTPILELLDKTQLVLKDESIKFSTLVSALESLAFKLSRNGKLNEFGFPDVTWEEAITHAELLGSVLLSHLVAGRTDLVHPEYVFSYNYTVNELTKSDDLVTFTEDGFNILYADLAKQMNLLVLYKRMVRNSATLLLNKQDNISIKLLHRLISNLKTIFFNNLSTEPEDALKDWKNYEEFRNALLSILPDSGHNLLEELVAINGLLTAELKFQLYLLQFKLNSAIFDFIQANKSKSKEEFADLFTKLISSPQEGQKPYMYTADIDSFESSDDPLQLKTIFSYIAAVGALSETDFSAAYIEALKNEKKFIHSNGLYNALYHETSFITLKDIWDKITFAFDALLQRDIENNNGLFTPGPEFYNASDSKRNTSTSLTFKDCLLTTGYSGTGKSTANEALLLSILKNVGNITNKIAIVHKTLALAEECIEDIVSKNIGLTVDNFQAFDHESYFKHINPNITPVDANNPVVDINSLELNSEDNTWHYKNEDLLNDSATKFSLVMIDEVTNISYLDLNVHQAFINKNNIRSICLGDFHQTTLIGEFRTPSSIEHLLLHAHNFLSTYNLALSFRSENKLNTNSLLAFLDVSKQNLNELYNLIDSVPEDAVAMFDILLAGTEYILNDSEFGGILVADTNDVEVINDEVKLAILHMVDTTKDPILVLGNNDQHPLYKYLKTLPNLSKFDFKEGVAQGRESDYAIMIADDINLEESNNPFADYAKFAKNVYTGISRAKIGSIVTNPTISDYSGPIFAKSKKRAVNAVSILTEDIVEDFNLLIISIYLTLLKDREIKPILLDYTIEAQTTTIPSILLLKNELAKFNKDVNELENEGLTPTLPTETFNAWLTAVNESTLPDAEKAVLLDEIKKLEIYVEVNDIDEGVDFLDSDLPYLNKDKDKMIAPIYSFNSYIIGVDKHGKITRIGKNNPVPEIDPDPKNWRYLNYPIVGLKGLINLLALKNDPNLSRYYNLGSISVTKEAIKELHSLYTQLYLGGHINSPLIPANCRIVLGFVNLNHLVSKSLHESANGKGESNHRLSALVIDETEETLVEIPLYTFPNTNAIVKSYIDADSILFKTDLAREDALKLYTTVDDITHKLNLLETWGYTAVSKLLTIYASDLNSIHYLSKNGSNLEWSDSYDSTKNYPTSFREVLGNNSEFLNILVLSLDKTSNGRYSYSPHPVTLISLVNGNNNPLNNIYVYPLAFAFQSDYEIEIKRNDETTLTKKIPAGKLFVIISLDPNLSNYVHFDVLEDLLKLVKNNKATILYINCPSSIPDSNGIVNNDDEIVNKILNAFLKDPKHFNSHQSIIKFAETLLIDDIKDYLEANGLKNNLNRIVKLLEALTKESSSIKWKDSVTDPGIRYATNALNSPYGISYGGALRSLTKKVIASIEDDNILQAYKNYLKNTLLYFPFEAQDEKHFLEGRFAYYDLNLTFGGTAITATVLGLLFNVYINGELRTCQEFGDITPLISIFDGVVTNPQNNSLQNNILNLPRVLYYKVFGYTNLYKKINENNSEYFVLVSNGKEYAVNINDFSSLSVSAAIQTFTNNETSFSNIYNDVVEDYKLLYNNNLIDKSIFKLLLMVHKYPGYELIDIINDTYTYDNKKYKFNENTLEMEEIVDIQEETNLVDNILTDSNFMRLLDVLKDNNTQENMNDLINGLDNADSNKNFKEDLIKYHYHKNLRDRNNTRLIREYIKNKYNITNDDFIRLNNC